MENRKNIVPNTNLKTELFSLLEIEKYMDILGANKTGYNTFILDGLECKVEESAYQGVMVLGGIPNIIRHLFKVYGLEDSIDSIYKSVILDLEGLVLFHTVLTAHCSENIDECFANNLKQVKKEMLERVFYFYGRKPMDFDSRFADFDRVITPFLNDDFDLDKFLEQCVFNTTGYYEEDGYDKCLKFRWRTKQEPDIIYAFEMNKNGFRDGITFKEYLARFHQQLLHYAYFDNEVLKFFYGRDIYTEFNVKNSEIVEGFGNIESTREATEIDLLKMVAIANSFIYEKPSFERIDDAKYKKRLW